MPRGSAAATSPLERAQNEAVEAYRKLASTTAEHEATVTKEASLRREVAYRTSLLQTTVQHPDLPEGFDVEAYVSSLPEEEEQPKRKPGRKSAAEKAAEAEKVAQDAGDAEAVADGTVDAVAEPTAPVETPADDDPFASLG